MGLRCTALTTSPPLQDVVSHLLFLSASIFTSPSCLLNKCHRNKELGGSGDRPKHKLCKWHQAKCQYYSGTETGTLETGQSPPLPQSSWRKGHPQGGGELCPSHSNAQNQ